MTIANLEKIEARLREFTKAPLYLSAGELTQTSSAYESENQLMQQAVEKRQREFFSGRFLARQALTRAGMPVGALPRGPLGNPIWPRTVVGAITHDQRYGVVVVAPDLDLQGIGIDLIEDPNQVQPELAEMIMHPDEETLLASLFPDLPPAAVAFSVKESVVKATSVFLGRFMDLLEIRLTASAQGLAAQVDGVPCSLPCIIFGTEIGLLSSSYFCHKK